MNILIIAAHLDDETFGIGGSLLKWKDRHNIKIVSLCKGRDDENSIERKNSFSKVIDVLKCKSEIGHHYDMELELVPLKEITYFIENIIKDFKPDIVITNSEFDIHQDHIITSKATKIACRPNRNNNIKEILEFKIPGSEPFSSSYFDTVIDIDDKILDKNTLCSFYISEKLPDIYHKEYFRTIYRRLDI